MLIYNVDRFIGDLCQHRFSMSAYTFNDGIGDICQHTCSMLTLCNAMVIYVSIDLLCRNICSIFNAMQFYCILFVKYLVFV